MTAIFWVVICLEYFQICDFGLAKWKQQAATQTTTGHRHGTVAYMAPEVFRDPNVSRTTKYDVYGFGILLWELLSDERPFDDGKIIYTQSDTITGLYVMQRAWLAIFHLKFFKPFLVLVLNLICYVSLSTSSHCSNVKVLSAQFHLWYSLFIDLM